MYPLNRAVRPVYLALVAATSEQLVAGDMVVEAVRDELATSPTCGDRLRLGLLDVTATASVRLGLHDPLDPHAVPPRRRQAAAGPASLTAGLELAFATIAQDATALGADGFRLERPVVWFVMCTAPAEDAGVLAELLRPVTEAPGSPVLVPCALATAVGADVLDTLVHPRGGPDHSRAYAADGEVAPRRLGVLIARTVLDAAVDRDAALTHPTAARTPDGVRAVAG